MLESIKKHSKAVAKILLISSIFLIHQYILYSSITLVGLTLLLFTLSKFEKTKDISNSITKYIASLCCSIFMSPLAIIKVINNLQENPSTLYNSKWLRLLCMMLCAALIGCPIVIPQINPIFWYASLLGISILIEMFNDQSLPNNKTLESYANNNPVIFSGISILLIMLAPKSTIIFLAIFLIIPCLANASQSNNISNTSIHQPVSPIAIAPKIAPIPNIVEKLFTIFNKNFFGESSDVDINPTKT